MAGRNASGYASNPGFRRRSATAATQGAERRSATMATLGSTAVLGEALPHWIGCAWDERSSLDEAIDMTLGLTPGLR
jgi:hypothetical protein